MILSPANGFAVGLRHYTYSTIAKIRKVLNAVRYRVSFLAVDMDDQCETLSSTGINTSEIVLNPSDCL